MAETKDVPELKEGMLLRYGGIVYKVAKGESAISFKRGAKYYNTIRLAVTLAEEEEKKKP